MFVLCGRCCCCNISSYKLVEGTDRTFRVGFINQITTDPQSVVSGTLVLRSYEDSVKREREFVLQVKQVSDERLAASEAEVASLEQQLKAAREQRSKELKKQGVLEEILGNKVGFEAQEESIAEIKKMTIDAMKTKTAASVSRTNQMTGSLMCCRTLCFDDKNSSNLIVFFSC